MTKFAQALDSAAGLAIEEQESLVEVLPHRLAEHRRAELVEAVKSARQKFKVGRCRPPRPRKSSKSNSDDGLVFLRRAFLQAG